MNVWATDVGVPVRIVDHLGQPVCEGRTTHVSIYSEISDTREVIRAETGTRGKGSVEQMRTFGHVTVTFPDVVELPLWYGGTYREPMNAHFTWPTGLHNVWGQGNDFDTDAFMIHPEDMETLRALDVLPR